MSKRRGKILQDAESIERRNWYNSLQQPKLEEVAKESQYFAQERQKSLVQLNNTEALKTEPSIRLNVSPWIISLNNVDQSKATVICFHGMGQNHGMFKRWQKGLSDVGVQLCGVCLPGRSNRASEVHSTSIRDVSIAIFLVMKAMNILTKRLSGGHYDDEEEPTPSTVRPLILFGHGVGSLIAYEVSKLLQDYHYYHTALIASSCPSPYQQGQNRFGKKMCFLSDLELLGHMKELGGVPEPFLKRDDMVKYFIPLFRKDYYLYDKYNLTPPAAVLSILEEDIENATDAAKLTLPAPSLDSREEEEEEMVYPVLLYRLHCEIVTIRVEDDPFVTEAEVSEWTHMSNNYDHITLDSVGSGGHTRALFENYDLILDLLKKYSGIM